ncbi:MAG TPA: cation diffusion facilitator family transporter [Nannocystaceae bacterium]|nr:cation diffusion facilitator family transporter [Nannocystaceae bacterium]
MSRPVRTQRVVALVTLAGSGVLVAGLFSAYLLFGSQLALAQAADSFLDVFTAAVLAYTIAVAAQPEDAEHPLGHSRAEPIGALITAIIAGVLSIEVARSAITALVGGEVARLDAVLLVAFGAKVIFKSVIFGVARRAGLGGQNPAMAALAVDARNDVMLSLVAIIGYFGARAGLPRLDAWLALPVAVWIGVAGLRLARDNLRLLMGEAPPIERQRELTRIAGATEGVRAAHPVVAHHLGTVLDVRVKVIVDAELTVKAAHDIGKAVRDRILQEPDVGHCSVHVDVE